MSKRSSGQPWTTKHPVFGTLPSTMYGPRLEYYVRVLVPYQKMVKISWKTQRSWPPRGMLARAARVVTRFHKLEGFSLRRQFTRGGLIQTFKTWRFLQENTWRNILSKPERDTKGCVSPPQRDQTRHAVKTRFFTNGLAPLWNRQQKMSKAMTLMGLNNFNMIGGMRHT